MDDLDHIVKMVSRLKPGQSIDCDLHCIYSVRKPCAIFGPVWNPVDRVMDRVVGSSWNIVPTENSMRHTVTFHRLEKESDEPTWISPDRRDA